MPQKDSQMNIDVKTTNMSLTPAISDYLTEKLLHLEKVINVEDDVTVQVDVELGKTTEHHQSGDDLFLAEININISGKHFRVESTQADIYAAIDEAKDDIMREIRKDKEKDGTLFKKGARKAKEMIRNVWRREEE